MGKIELLTYLLAINVVLVLIFAQQCASTSKFSPQDATEYNEFAEFEEFDDDLDEFEQPSLQAPNLQQPSSTPAKPAQPVLPSTAKTEADVDGVVEDDYEEEFESVREDTDDLSDKINPGENAKTPDLKITKIPFHLRANWESYYLEFSMVVILLIYFINYAAGKSKNSRIANAWLERSLDLLNYNFALVGDDGKKEIESHGLLKETENVFTLWCSGRISVDGLLAEIRLIKRQDLFSSLINYFKPTNDKIVIKVFLSPDTLDNFVFCIAHRKVAIKLSKEITDIATYCPERKNPDKYGVSSSNYLLLSEIGEAASFILDAKIVSLLDKNDDLIEFIHISDQYSGMRNDDTQPSTKLPEVKKVLILSLNLPPNSSHDLEELERMKPLLQMVFYLVDKLKRFRLSREKKAKAERNRQKVEKLFLQSTHLQRQEAAQIKREEKRRQEKERMLAEMDPEKQRRWEEKEYKREMKRKVPKMKQLKVKAM